MNSTDGDDRCENALPPKHSSTLFRAGSMCKGRVIRSGHHQMLRKVPRGPNLYRLGSNADKVPIGTSDSGLSQSHPRAAAASWTSGNPGSGLGPEPLDPATRSSGEPLIAVPGHQLENAEASARWTTLMSAA